VFFFVDEEEYRVVRVESGTLAVERVVVEVPCPVDGAPMPVGGLVRLSLVEKRPSDWPEISHTSKLPLRRYAAGRQSLLRSILNLTRAEVTALWPVTIDGAPWVQHGADLAIAYEGDRVARLRVRLPDHWPAGDYFRMGLDDGRPSRTSRGWYWACDRRDNCLSPGIAGHRKGRVLELWRAGVVAPRQAE
jgi:hypothetical protein